MLRSAFRSLECSATGKSLPTGQLHNLSPAGKPILCRYALDTVRQTVDRDEIRTRARGMWRWRELLPLRSDAEPVTLGEGDTPLLSAPRLARELGIEELTIKDESVNPTGSFKARGLSAAVTMAKDLGAKAVIVPSAGNAGGAMAAYAARAGLPAHVIVPADTPEINQLEVPLFGGHLTRIEGLIDDCGKVVAEQREALGAFNLSTLKEPYRLEGKKTLGFELAEQFAWRLPDVIIYPTGGGTGLIGMHKAFAELAELGWLESDKRPRFVVVQAQGCAPIVRAFDAGHTSATHWDEAATCASGLRVPGAVGDFLILKALRETRGTAVSIADDALVREMRHMAATEGINAAPEGGACLAAARQLRSTGWISSGEKVVLFNTGAGTKYVEVLRAIAAGAADPGAG
ncbi:MAG: threonine synthase [Nannocystaceae bacterium]